VYDRLVRHWWNNGWGRLNRRDVYVRTDGGTFQLELRLGGVEGRRARRPFDTLDEAIAEAEQHMDPDQKWVDITGADTRGTGPTESERPAR
jgi:hypothetical protein